MIGATKLTIDYTASTAQGVQLNARLYDVFPDGTQVMVDRGPVPRDERDGHRHLRAARQRLALRAGHRIRIELSQDDSPS